MKTKNIILVIILAAVALGIWAFGHNLFTQSSSQKGHHDVWYCPMHPFYTSDKPGTCPICYMKLVKRLGNPKAELQEQLAESKQSDAIAQGYATISVPEQKQQLIGLRTENIKRQPVVKIIRAYGVVSSDVQLYQIQGEFIDAFVNYFKLERDYKRIRVRRGTWQPYKDMQIAWLEARDKLLKLGFSEKEIGELQNISWTSQFNQIVVREPKLQMFDDSRSYWVIAQIFEQDLEFVKVGQEAEVNISAYEEKTKGTIRVVGSFIDPTSRSVTALIELKDYQGQLAANMLTDITIPVKLVDALFVPREAVMDTGVRKVVFVEKEEGTFEPRDIQTGWETDDGYEVISGLKEGERIVVSGNFLLDSESRVQAGLEQVDSHGQ